MQVNSTLVDATFCDLLAGTELTDDGGATQLNVGDLDYPTAAPVTGRSQITYANSGTFNSRGIDASANLVRDYDFGSFTFKADATYILEWNDEQYFGGPLIDKIGTNGRPQWRGNFGAQFDRGDHSLAANLAYIDEYDQDGDPIDSWTTYDLRYTWQSPWDASLSVGCRNCTNEEPPMDPYQNHNDELHNIYGLVSYVSVTGNF